MDSDSQYSIDSDFQYSIDSDSESFYERVKYITNLANEPRKVTVPCIVRFLELLPGLRCRVRAPNGFFIYILKIPDYLIDEDLEPGVYLDAEVNLERVEGKLDGIVTGILKMCNIAQLLLDGLWPDAFIEAEYISEKLNKLLFSINAAKKHVIQSEDENRKASRW